MAVGLLTLASFPAAFAVTPFTVRDIRVEGLQRVEAGTVFATLPFRVGETYTDDKGALSIRNLFALGLFKDVRIEVSGDVLVLIVEERPTVNGIDFTGAREFDKEFLGRMMREIGLLEGRPFDKAVADKAEQEIKRQYLSRSFFATKVTTTATPIDRNRVNLTFAIEEGDLAKIKDITITGNKAFSESTLLSQFNSDNGSWLSWYTKSNRYSKAKLTADLESLRAYYLGKGYIEFRADPPKVDITPNQDEIVITVNVHEGPQYVVSGVKLEGNYLGKENEFKSLVSIDVGKSFNAEQVSETTRAFTNNFGTFGYAFAKVDVVPLLDRANGLVTLVYKAEPGLRAYVRKINISGNNRTRDEVVRREFRQFESSWYDGDKIRASRDRVDRLGFFTEVQIDTEEVPGAPDQVDINMALTEKPTGNLSFGAGYSSSDKMTFQAGIKQENVFGSGNYLGLEVNTSKLNRQAVVTSVDPYFTVDGISRTADVFYRTTRPSTALDTDFRQLNKGLGLKFGVPFSDTDTVYFGATYDQLEIIDGTNIPKAYKDYVTEYGAKSYTVPFSIGWGRDSRDSALAPNSGSYQRLNLEFNTIGDARYVKATAQYQKYIPINKQFTFAFNTQFDWGKGLGGRSFPVFKNSYAGGLGSVRGFESNTLGPKEEETGLYVGGPKRVNANFEILAPFPGSGNDRTLRMYAFVDAGNVFGANDPISFSDLRSSVGVGISWISPIGPLRISYAKPIKKAETDKLQKIQFQIGTSF
jgi:outer membrane protein insertion porin family